MQLGGIVVWSWFSQSGSTETIMYSNHHDCRVSASYSYTPLVVTEDEAIL